MSNYCIILAGGTGVRLWPVSRHRLPKQFLDIFGTGRTLLQATFDRMARLFPADRIIISTCEDQTEMVAEQLPEIPERNILAEPIRRGTMPAALWANAFILERDPEACVICVPSDQIVLREHEFERDVQDTLAFVNRHKCPVTLGITPTRAETFYGYIQAGDCIGGDERFASVRAFTEKPDMQFAKMFVESGEFYWNTGINVWHAQTMLEAMNTLEPDYAAKLTAERSRTGDAFSEVMRRNFGFLPNMSLDLTIQNRIPNVCVRVCRFGWADMGNWHSMHEDLPTDRDGNVVLHSEALLYECSGNVIKMPRGVTVVMQDIHDKVVVQEGGVLLIAPKDNYAELRRVMTDAHIKLASKE